MGQLNDREITAANALISHAEALITARGRSTEHLGLYEELPFKISFRQTEEETGLQIDYWGKTVMRIAWDSAGDPGTVYTQPGSWQDELLRLRAAHS